MRFDLIHGDSYVVVARLDENSVDAIVTDPPYGIGFMGKDWDHGVPSTLFWKHCLRALKPGGHLLCFAGTRTHHRMATAIEDAGFEIRDMIGWTYGSGFPKSLNVSKAMDKHLGATRGKRRIPQSAVRNQKATGGGRDGQKGASRPFIEEAMRRGYHEVDDDTPVTPEAERWDGYGTCLKPAFEPITLARKPLSGTVVQTVLEHGTGVLNIDGCRVPSNDGATNFSMKSGPRGGSEKGRFPANLIHDGSKEVLSCFPDSKGQQGDVGPLAATRKPGNNCYGEYGPRPERLKRGDSGSAARFFYCAKASKRERGQGNNHPTVKPLALMKHLVTLVAPPEALVLDPFMGSGTTALACKSLNRAFIGVELEKAYYNIAVARLQEPIDDIEEPGETLDAATTQMELL